MTLTHNEGHPHAHHMLSYAQDAANTTTPWQYWSYLIPPDQGWIQCTTHPSWHSAYKFKRKPLEVVTQNILQAILDGKTIQTQDEVTGIWKDYATNQTLSILAAVEKGRISVRVKPLTIIVNGIRVPAPITTAPPLGTTVYFPDIYSPSKFQSVVWKGPTPYLSYILGSGLMYLKQEDALARTNAMLTFTIEETHTINLN